MHHERVCCYKDPLVSLLIRNATILTMNDRWEVVEGGGVLVKDGVIVDVGPHVGAHATAGESDLTVIDAAQGYLSFLASSRPTSTCVRRCFAAAPTIWRCSIG